MATTVLRAQPAAGFFTSDLWRIAGLILLWKLVVLATISGAYFLLPLNEAQYTISTRYPAQLRIEAFETRLKTWDAQHYLHLSDRGYSEGGESNAFYPLYPLAIRALNSLSPNLTANGLIVSNLASLGGLLLFYAFVRKHWSDQVAIRALLLFMAFPTAFYLNLIYSEALFVLLAMVFFYYLYERNYSLAALAAFLLPLVRFVGVFSFLAFAAFLYLERRRTRGEQTRPSAASYGYLLAPLLGAVAYLGIMLATTGDAFAGLSSLQVIDATKDPESVYKPWVLFESFFRSDLVLHGFRNSIVDRAFFVAFLASLPFVYRRVGLPLFLFYAGVGAVVPLMGSFMSYMRYVMIGFPMYIALGGWFSERRSFLFSGLLIVMAAAQVFLIVRHSLNHWVA